MHVCTCVCHGTFMCVTWHTHTCGMTDAVSVASNLHVCVTWLVHVCDTPHWHVWRDSFISVTRLIHMCHTPHSYLWHASFIVVTRFIHMCDTPHWHVWRDSFICVTHLNLCIFLHYPPDLRHKKNHILIFTFSHTFSFFFGDLCLSSLSARPTS